MKTLSFRFDIDTHKCIRSGVPRLLQLGQKYQVCFSFFLNMGRSISLIESIKELCKKTPGGERYDMMSAQSKLGIKDYLEAAVLNPPLSCYKKQIKAIYDSGSELGIHGSKNHALWHKHAGSWSEEKTDAEISWAIEKIKKVLPDYQLKGFASPGWVSPDGLEKVLEKYGFSYCADYRCQNKKDVIKMGNCLPYIGVNMLGEPGGVAFFENCRVKGMDKNEIVAYVMEAVALNENTVIYDHPYYAGMKEIDCIGEIIEKAEERNVKIVTLESLL